MPTTQNKGYEVQVTGSNTGTWGATLNDDMIAIVDANLGGIVIKSVAGSNITLTSDESQNCIIRLIGAQSADIQLTNPCIGFYFVENLTTNSFNTTVTNGVAGVVVPKGRSTLIADPTNGVRIASGSIFDLGTVVIFQQSAAPTGWTKITTNNDKALRIVSGAVSTGGSVAFSTAFASQAVTGTVGNTTLTIDQIPLHGHPWRQGPSQVDTTKSNGGFALSGTDSSGGNSVTRPAYTGAPSDTPGQQIGGTGGGLPHNHSFTGTSINLAVQYVDVIAARYGN